MRLISRPPPEPAVTGEESRAALPWADGPLGWRAVLTAECGFHAARRLHRLVWAAATLERAPAATDRRDPEPAGDAFRGSSLATAAVGAQIADYILANAARAVGGDESASDADC